MQTLAPLFAYLQDQQVMPPEQPAPATPAEELLAGYRHLAQERGVAPLTALRYERMARRFLAGRISRAGVVIGAENLSGAEVTAYLVGCCSRLKTIGSAKREAADLRSLLRFFYLKGITATDLGTAMPPVAGWRDTRLPATMSAADVAALLGACDRSQPSGLRDLAILTLLVRLGLRSGEVAALELGDINWRAGEIVVRGKARRRCQRPAAPAVHLPGAPRSRLHLLVPVGRPGAAGTGRRPPASSPGGPAVTALAPTLQLFFTERLAGQRQACPQTVTSYRNTFRLLLRFIQQRTGKAPSSLDWDDLSAEAISAFLDHLEAGRGNSARSRNARLAALRSLANRPAAIGADRAHLRRRPAHRTCPHPLHRQRPQAAMRATDTGHRRDLARMAAGTRKPLG
jgi:site-specific recombinase XerD